MVTWQDVRCWDHEALMYAAQDLESLRTSLTGIGRDADLALSRVASRAPSVEAARSTLRRCNAAHHELLTRVDSLVRATSQAHDGVAEVRRRVLACQNYAAARPFLTLHSDGTVSTRPDAGSGSGSPGTGGWTTANAAFTINAGSAVDAGRQREQAAELAFMVSETLTRADQVDHDFVTTLTALSAPDPQPGPSPAPPNPDQPVPTRSQQNRDDAVRASRTGRLRRGGGLRDNSVGGGDSGNKSDKLGPPVSGEHASMPGVDPWKYQGDSTTEGSGPHGQRSPTLKDIAVHEATAIAATMCRNIWPDASDNLYHYLENTGEAQSINVDGMLEDLDDMRNNSQERVNVMLRDAIDDAKRNAEESGTTGPVTYPFSTAWRLEYVDQDEHPNWFYATGGCQYATEGTITLYPPTSDNPKWTYSYNYRVHVADRYNWDGNKSTQIFGMTVTDAQLQELHRAGLAQEYDLAGQSSIKRGSGEWNE